MNAHFSLIGTRLAHYQVTQHLGSGGMGEVYQATDSKLGRSVALKVLPEVFARDAERVARLEREARLLAALNHPNIAFIFGFERERDRNFLVMEFVDGETLADRIKRGPIPLHEALGYSKEILEALDAAHEKGVIHRDLKPANIKITSDGKVKVLDFGLAKSMESESASAVTSNSPTMSIAATQAGVILGTASYMSPEQAKGKSVDRRTDIFAFGCVLFEMLAGKRAFDGDDVSDALGAVLRMEPDWTLLPKDLPSGIRNLLRLCLEKNPKNRRGSASDVRLDIELTLKEPAAEHIRAPLWKRAIPVVVTAMAFAVIAAVTSWNLKPSPAAAPVTRFTFALPDDQQFTNPGRHILAFSPDASRFVYVANNRLYLKPMNQLSATMIPGTEIAQGVLNPVFSPDGQEVLFFSQADQTLKRVTLTGGAPSVLATIKYPPFGISWGADGQILVGQGDAGILRISSAGGPPQTIVTMKTNELAHGPQLLPDGDTVLFTLAMRGAVSTWSKAQVVVQSLKSGERKVLVNAGTDASYLPTGHLVYEHSNQLLAVPFDVNRLAVNGNPVVVVNSIQSPSNNTGAAQWNVSKTGSLIYLPAADQAADNTLQLVDRNGKATPLSLPPGRYAHPRLSPNGKQVAFHTDDQKGERIIWIYDLDGSTSMRQLTFTGRNAYPVWSPDGSRILFQSDREGDLGIFVQRADGTGTAEHLTQPDAEYYSHIPESWAPDGETFSFVAGKGSDANVRTYSFRDKKVTLFADAPLWQQSSTFSPDGHWVAYLTEEKGRNVVVTPFPKTDAKFQIKDSATHPVWSPDGKELFFMNNVANGQLYSVSVRTRPAFAFGNPVALPIKGFVQGAGNYRNFDISPDGKQFIVIMPTARPTDSSKTSQIQVVLNWFTELQQRVPVK